MVNFTPHFLTLLAFGHAVAAAQTVTSFSEWVEGIIADPNGDHLSPEDAVAAFKSGAFSVPPAVKPRRGLVEKRATCYEVPGTEALIVDAVACINAIARRAPDSCREYMLCQLNTAAITQDGGGPGRWSSCNDVARGAGYVMDHCVRPGSDWVQGSEFAHGNGNLLVRIRRP
ncbi:hypothetical protein MMYC01_208796 [Madurella mycetomatis]|uniref:Uncharacterized protein n=1 Tax=Madurella mycetomatis TaxID=100816 RepID=A0A175VVJ2_9PEZI|nr:hypothetical protein MMYC01_208796 [Madurella mycetomatis]